VSTIDLEHGEPDPDESPAAKRRRERRASGGDSGGSRSSSSSKSSTERSDTSLVTRMDTAFSKIADQMDAREDEELAEAIRDERHAMSQGLVSLTGSITPLRPLLVLVLSLIEPVLAFWRVGRILFLRFLTWRERRIVAAQQAEWERAAQESGTVTPANVPVG
jgi:hypothetical protein